MSLRRVAVSLVALLALAGCGGAANADGARTTTDTIDGQTVRIDLPAGKVRAVAIWLHGQGGDADTRMNEPWLNALRADGWAVASSDFHGNHWGSRESVSDVAKLTAWAGQKANAPVRLHVAGSMGGLASLNALTHGQDVPCWYGVMPVLDQSTTARVPEAREQIADVWGESVPAEWVPARNLDRLPSGMVMRVVASPSDTWVPADRNGLLLQRATVKAASGQHGDPSHFDAADLRDFAAGCQTTSQ
jgi:hypothetical protein